MSAVPSSFVPGLWLVGPAGKVGAARVGDVVVRIRPKVEIARLLFMLGYSVHGTAWQTCAVDVGEAPSWSPPSPRRCGGRWRVRSVKGCCPATSPAKTARPCCAAGSWKARS
ncbi:MAG TPA: hypothetical protein VFQ68_14635, partial [Streptosporangiaceae bacterium]|nr:hypothetical protein [Streptosporangiaceae bacterium]